MIAFLFPGQGSQRPGMGRPWVQRWPDLFRVAAEATGRDVFRLVCDADAEELRSTDNAQVATAVCSLAALASLAEAGLRPAAVAGHSLGEYAALVAAGAVAPEAGMRLVAARGAGMAEAAQRHPGTMTALLGAGVEAAEAACEKAGGTVCVANVNAPDQVVLSGTEDALGRAVDGARALGARKALPLRVGGAFHSPLMAPALPALATALGRTDFVDPGVPVVCNVDGLPRRDAGALVPVLLAQLCSPVLWHKSLETLAAMGIRGFVEVGSGGVLLKLAKRALPGAVVTAVAVPADAEAAAAALAGAVPAELRPAPANDTYGEVVDMADSVVVAQVRGRFRPAPPQAYTAEGEYVAVDQIVGEIDTPEGLVAVRSRIAGWVMNLLAGRDDRVEVGQPLLTVRPF